MSKLQIISDKNKKSSNIKNLLLNKIKSNQFKKENLIIVIGGDGFMLQTLKKNKSSNKHFYGINSGNYGFLMNKFSSKDILKNLSKANLVSISPLEMIVRNKNNQTKRSIAINEVSVLRQSRQAASLSIKQGSKQIIKKLVSDGVLVSTPAGSTAYNLSVHGPILSLHSKKLSISPISAFRPRRWKGKIVSNKSKIIIKNLNPKNTFKLTRAFTHFMNFINLAELIDASRSLNEYENNKKKISDRNLFIEEIFEGMTLNDFHSPVYLSTGGEISQTCNSEELIEIPLFISSMTPEDFGKELIIDYELSHINYIAQKSILHSNQIKIDYNPWVQKSLPSLKLTMAKVSGLSKLTLALKTIQGEVLHRNFMHFEVISGEELKNAVVFDTNVKSFSNSSWSNKSWLVFDGKKANGTGSGFFEYEIAIPKEIKVQNHKEAFFIAELSSKEFFDKDKDDIIIEDGLDYMKGSIQSPSTNPNSYPMTDTKRFQSKIDIYVNDKFKLDVTLNDDPADHRGVLSWHNQVRSELGSVKLEEAGSYGYLVKIPISHEELENSIKKGKIKIKFKTKGKNGIAIYGKSFGRYPINPSLVILN